MSNQTNVVHKKVGQIFRQLITTDPSLTLLQDYACGGKQRLPLFCVPNKSRANEFCNVDFLVLKDGKIKVIVEIEESNVKPTQVCGKLLTSALAKYFIHECEANKPVEMADSVLFIQIVDTSKLVRGKTAKYEQWKALEKSINQILPVKDSSIKSYKLLTTNDLTELEAIIKKNLQ